MAMITKKFRKFVLSAKHNKYVQEMPTTLSRLPLILGLMVGVLQLINFAKLFARSNTKPVQIVTRQELINAMRLQKGYDPTATTNVPRFQGQVILQLARWARDCEPNGPPLLIDHTDWFYAFLEANDLTIEEAPTFSLLSYHHGQDFIIDYRTEVVIEKVCKGSSPILAVNVIVFWPKTAQCPGKYSFHDTLSTPHLKVTNRRVITYRLLDFGDMIVYDDIHGITGRPTSGVLGVLFRIIGEGRVVQSRIAISSDGLQITHAHAKKGIFSVKSTVTVYPNGRTEKNVPTDRKDLRALAAQLKQSLKIKYISWESTQKFLHDCEKH